MGDSGFSLARAGNELAQDYDAAGRNIVILARSRVLGFHLSEDINRLLWRDVFNHLFDGAHKLGNGRNRRPCSRTCRINVGATDSAAAIAANIQTALRGANRRRATAIIDAEGRRSSKLHEGC